MAKDIKFTEFINTLHEQVQDYIGMAVYEHALAWFSDEENMVLTADSFEDAFKYNAEGMFSLLRMLMNFDFFWVRDGRVDIVNAMQPEVAQLVAPYVDADTAQRLIDTF